MVLAASIPNPTRALREHAIAASEQHRAFVDAQRIKHHSLKLQRLEEQFIGLLRSRLDVEVTAEQLHTISDGGVPVPAWRTSADDDAILLSMQYREGEYRLCYVWWCNRCEQLTKVPVWSLITLGDIERDGVQCGNPRCEANWRRW